VLPWPLSDADALAASGFTISQAAAAHLLWPTGSCPAATVVGVPGRTAPGERRAVSLAPKWRSPLVPWE